jgi:CCDC81-like prokaryotic HU domain 1
MESHLYNYLVQYKELALPGVGTIHLQRSPAQHDYANKVFTAPVYTFSFNRNQDMPSKKLFGWLAGSLGISEWEAIRKLNDFAFAVKKQLQAGKEINWDGVGTMQSALSGEVRFKPVETVFPYEQPVAAEKVIREKADHTILVGENEKTSGEMTELLSHHESKRNYALTVAWTVVLLAVLFIGLYLSGKGLTTAAVSNSNSVEPNAQPATYKLSE